MTAEAESLEVDEQLGLEALARVEAAEQDDVPLEEVLAELEVEQDAWWGARPSLIEKASQDAGSFKSYQAALETAQDGYHRSVEPLFDDVEAWVAYSLALGAPTGCAALLTEKGLTLGDLGRLERHWRQRMQEDPATAKRAKEAKEAVMGKPLPDIVIGPRICGTPAKKESENAVADTGKSESTSPDLYEQAERAAVLKALLEQDDAAEGLRQRGVESVEEAVAEVERVIAMLSEDPVVYGFFRRRVDHVRGLLERGGAAPTSGSPAPSPMVASPPNLLTPPLASPSGPSELDVTGPIDFHRLGLDSLPFDPNASTAAPVPLPEEAHPEVGATAFVDAAALGLGDLDPEAAPDPAAQSIDGTGFLDPNTLGDLDESLPFDEAAPVVAPKKASLLPHRARGGTALQAPGSVVPWSTPFPAADGRGSRPPEELTSDVKRYASYRVDLLRAPQNAAQTRARYGIASDQAHANLVASYDARFAADSNLAAEYQEAVRTYSAWLATNGRT